MRSPNTLLNRVDLPLLRHPFELMAAPIDEREIRPGDELFHRAGAEDLAGFRLSTDTRGDVNGDAADLVAAKLDLAGV